MDLVNIFSVTALLVLLYISGVRSAAITLSQSAEKGQLGSNSLSLYCDYNLSASESVLTIELKRKRDSDSSFYSVVAFYEDQFNASYSSNDSDIVGRTVLTNPASSNRRATLQFSSILCADEADYRCELFYRISGLGNRLIFSDTRIVVTAKPMFGNQSLLYTPSTNLAENQNVTFTCSGNVGREPQGTFSWYRYVGGQAPAMAITNGIKPVSLTNVAGSCTYVRTENLTLTLAKEDNQMVIRCTVRQTTMTEEGDGNIQTNNISVYYVPRINPIGSNPNSPVYSEGLQQLLLTCNADSSPPSNYVWTLPDGTLQTGYQLRLTNLTTNHTGRYTCLAYASWGGQNYTANSSIDIIVVSVTKAPGAATNSGNVSQADSTTGMIIGIVIGGVVLIAVIIIAVVCIKKRKKQEIEEPAEKPRNNRDLVFTGNRPDLVTNDDKWKKNQNNHMQNTSLNNSYDSSDSKMKGDGQLTYVDLQFDDKPRSRKPIQLIDADSTPYADIAMPRV
ncbi:hypothetical protein ACJMK2_026513 [Sinanodonta woodiana]|uniref:Ig-like domain-containing protein n=1 Tax=Sinanodonta woodiana TaxID=1069815 RepID=A0ABD3XNJ7_SINWO